MYMYRTYLKTLLFHQYTQFKLFSAFWGCRIDKLRLGILEQPLARLFLLEMAFPILFVLILFEGDGGVVEAGFVLKVGAHTHYARIQKDLQKENFVIYSITNFPSKNALCISQHMRYGNTSFYRGRLLGEKICTCT